MNLVLTKPMDSFTGSLVYTEYVKGTNKGQSQAGDLIRNYAKEGTVDPTYTSPAVEATLPVVSKVITLKWSPVIPGTINFTVGDDKFFDDGNGTLYKGNFASRIYKNVQVDEDGRLEGIAGRYEIDPGTAEAVGTVTYGSPKTTSVNGAIYDANTDAAITFTNAPDFAEALVSYKYNMVAIVQNDIPTLVARNKAIVLEAKPRRIAIRYSQLAALQQKLEYNKDLGKDLEVQAVAQLKYKQNCTLI